MPDGSLKLRGRVRAVLGDDIDTDMIYPGRYLNVTDREKTAEHLFELAFPELRANLEAGDIIMTGTPAGVAATVAGDKLECEVEGIGKLTVTIGQPLK